MKTLNVLFDKLMPRKNYTLPAGTLVEINRLHIWDGRIIRATTAGWYDVEIAGIGTAPVRREDIIKIL